MDRKYLGHLDFFWMETLSSYHPGHTFWRRFGAYYMSVLPGAYVYCGIFGSNLA
jgi:hypothetical protein